MSTDVTTSAPPRTALAVLLALGLFVTLLNAFKPLTVDDSVYYLFAVHLAEAPLDPYGFRAWGAQDANAILAPPVFLYWWALAVNLFGQEPVYWKLWVLPFNLLLVFALHALGRRYARGMELPFVCVVALSGTVLPCVNLMLDTPALALSLFAIVLFLRAAENDSLRGAVAAGVVAGVATQTKYTAFVVPGVVLLHALQSRKWRLGFVAAALPGLMFVGWELLMAWRYGNSHFWLGAMQFRAPLSAKVRLVQPLFGYLGGTFAAGLPLALAALGGSTRVVGASAALVVSVFAFVAFPPGAVLDSLRVAPTPGLTGVLFGLIGFALFGALAAVARRLARQPRTAEGAPARTWFASADGFLFLWLVLELGAYFALSPYPATRRILGVVVVAALLTCRLAARTCHGRERLIWGVAGINFLLGLFLFAIDFAWSYGYQEAARDLARECRQQEPKADIWYFGNGTFEFYGDRLGMKRVIAPEVGPRPGDWVLVTDGFQPVYARDPLAARCVLQHVYEWSPVLPVRSQYQFGNVAVARQEEPSARVTLYRVRK